ncbi:hypothetical protein [Mycobacterium szulgai]|uniref:hypothetical protein n=1 Tax=Mycobacterium szulgai TaxID=1787 RepID=UPI000A1E6401|nr:hypothetical protein [Mycobacterium szulgai]MCV7077104.1 hypothetical protein [Mycobacterium szulgai]
MSTNREYPLAGCSLGAADYESRIAWIEDLNTSWLRSYHRDGRRIRLGYDPAAAEQARALILREQTCCPFLRFATEEAQDGFVVIIEAPAELGTVADALFASGSATDHHHGPRSAALERH